MLVATLLALAAAVIHAAWNLAVKQSPVDRFLALWGQFTMAALLFSPLVFILGGMPAAAWPWVAVSGAAHLPYCWYLAEAYRLGEFSLVYPIARGGGALLAAIGGLALLDDRLSVLSIMAIAIVGAGLAALAGRGNWQDVRLAAIVAVTIGVYSVADARGIRVAGTKLYALASVLGTAASTTLFGLARGMRAEMTAAMLSWWRRFAIIGTASTITYGLVQVAFQRAPVGYVTALRESSVVLAGWLGWRHLGERAGVRRMVASAVVIGGLILLVTTA
jgi:drug/metabolite transporter (DMT)-like permease